MSKAELLKNEEIKKLLAEYASLYRRRASIIGCAGEIDLAVTFAVDDMLNQMRDLNEPACYLRGEIAYDGEKLMEFMMKKHNAQKAA